MPYTPRRYTMLHLGAMGMESLAPEFFNITTRKVGLLHLHTPPQRSLLLAPGL